MAFRHRSSVNTYIDDSSFSGGQPSQVSHNARNNLRRGSVVVEDQQVHGPGWQIIEDVRSSQSQKGLLQLSRSEGLGNRSNIVSEDGEEAGGRKVSRHERWQGTVYHGVERNCGVDEAVVKARLERDQVTSGVECGAEILGGIDGEKVGKQASSVRRGH